MYGPPGIVLDGVHKSYGPVKAVRGVDLRIDPGETVALLGPNGAGKSTTIDVLLGLAQPDTGQVSLFGTAPADAVSAGRVGGPTAALDVGGRHDSWGSMRGKAHTGKTVVFATHYLEEADAYDRSSRAVGAWP